MVDLTSLIRDLGAAKEGSRELDMRIGKALDRMPADAEWGNGDDSEGLPPSAHDLWLKVTNEWITPAYRDYRRALRAFVATRPTAEEFHRWDDEHQIAMPTSDATSPAGSVRLYTRSVDAALTLVPERWRWKVALSGVGKGAARVEMWTIHYVDYPLPANVKAKGYTPALAIAAASLRARVPWDARVEKTIETAAVDTPKTGAANV